MAQSVIRKYRGMLRQQWRQLASGLNNTMLCGASEPWTGGFDIGDVYITVNVRPIITMNRDAVTGATTQVFQDAPIAFPIQCIFLTNPAVDPRFQESPPQTVAERFLPTQELYILGSKSTITCPCMDLQALYEVKI